ncbi:hypothetical protein CASFOL_033861 [Castilleja foliolosa]|uniref:Uncharacterized protein n=1 Tax=Castilleja foliolosa TaxID=1961234 RepID=A0ABD3C0N2_9LAMI
MSLDKSYDHNRFIDPLKATAACNIIFATIAFGKFPNLAARAETLTTSETLIEELLESKPDAIDVLKRLLQEKLDSGDDEESLSILRKLSPPSLIASNKGF